MLGLIARADDTGLGNQTRALCYMLKPDRVLIINSKSFNGNEQHNDWYDGFNTQVTKAWPTNAEMYKFMNGLTHMLSAETIYNNAAYGYGKRFGTKIFIQPNWEFLDHLRDNLPQPNKWLMPSYWHLNDMNDLFGNAVYLPPPIFLNDFKKSREINLSRSGRRRFLHVVGKAAFMDRNGTIDLLNSLKYSTGEFDLVIHSQFELDEYKDLTDDQRVSFQIGNIKDPRDIYSGYDAMILPRRYGGLCLPMNEALSSALPVVMTNVSPNNDVLKRDWLVNAFVKQEIFTRSKIDLFESDLKQLASTIDTFANYSDQEMMNEKLDALEIAQSEYSSDKLIEKYKKEMQL